MATDWSAILAAVIAALGGGAVGAWLQGRRQDRAERTQRRDRAAEVLAEARAFLTDVTPDRLGINTSQERSPQVLQELGERRERIRVPLLTLAHSHPSATVRDLASRLEVEMANTLTMAGWFVSDLLRNRDVDSARDTANQHHAEALRLLDQLVEAIQRA
jgi:hypothetical protein